MQFEIGLSRCPSLCKGHSHDPVFGANYYLIEFKEDSDANQPFYELKQCQKILDPKNRSCEPTLIAVFYT